MRCAPMSRPVSRPSGRDVQCLKATFRLTRKASASRSTGTPVNCLREARAARKGLISSPKLPRAFIALTRLADGRAVKCIDKFEQLRSRSNHSAKADEAVGTMEETD